MKRAMFICVGQARKLKAQLGDPNYTSQTAGSGVLIWPELLKMLLVTDKWPASEFQSREQLNQKGPVDHSQTAARSLHATSLEQRMQVPVADLHVRMGFTLLQGFTLAGCISTYVIVLILPLGPAKPTLDTIWPFKKSTFLWHKWTMQGEIPQPGTTRSLETVIWVFRHEVTSETKCPKGNRQKVIIYKVATGACYLLSLIIVTPPMQLEKK